MKTAIIGFTTFREIARRPMFWLILVAAIVLQWLIWALPYYTFGEDLKMVKDQGLEVILGTGLVIAIFSASVSIADEIDGKTAITLLSKPIRRRDFIMGKYFGIMAAVMLLFSLLSVNFSAVIFNKTYEQAEELKIDPPTTIEAVSSVWMMAPGVVLAYFKVAILCAICVALSTRLPVHLNITACIAVYLLGHIAPQLEQASDQKQFEGVRFLARFFATILPGLEYFNVAPAIATDAVVPWVAYVLPCFIYTALYTGLALALALLMFEDRDLA